MTKWLITGCSSGLGRALAVAVLDAGHCAVVTARSTDSVQDLVERYPDTARAVALEVSNPDQIRRAVEVATEAFGGIDVLVNNAGHGYRSAVEEGVAAEVGELFSTNLFGPVELIKAVLPAMRAQRSGAIVNVSSIAARWVPAGSGYYGASKAALEAVSDALRREVAPLGIKVVVVEPGGFRTDFAGRSLQQSSVVIDDYADTAGLRRPERDDSHGKQPGDPTRAGKALLEALEATEPPFRLLLGSDAVAVIGAELAEQTAEVERWADFSGQTDFESGA